jgi:hypothetical protein
MPWLKLGSLVFNAVAMLVTQGIPVGTAFPVVLNATLDARKDKPGQKIEARLMQDIPLPSGEKIKAGAHVTGHIVEVTNAAGRGSGMVLKFDQLTAGGRTVPLTFSVRAIAAMESVYAAEVPVDAESNYEPANQWVMRQVGGDIVKRGRGLIVSNDAIVGRWNGAAWGRLTTALDGDCTAADGNDIEQALWVFSTSACGLYGFQDMKLVRNGRTDPVGQIVLESGKVLHIGGGSGWFLVSASSSAF